MNSVCVPSPSPPVAYYNGRWVYDYAYQFLIISIARVHFTIGQRASRRLPLPSAGCQFVLFCHPSHHNISFLRTCGGYKTRSRVKRGAFYCRWSPSKVCMGIALKIYNLEKKRICVAGWLLFVIILGVCWLSAVQLKRSFALKPSREEESISGEGRGDFYSNSMSVSSFSWHNLIVCLR